MPTSPMLYPTVGTLLPRYERVGSVAVGALAMTLGLSRRSSLGLLLAALGAPMLVRGVLGRPLVEHGLDLGVEAHRSVTIRRPRSEVYRYWRDFQNLPRFMSHLREVSPEDGRTSRWIIEEGPLVLEWMAQIVDDVVDRRIAWQSLPGSDVENEGLVEFRDAHGGRGTEIEVTIRYRPPGGLLATAMLRRLLRRFTAHQLRVELIRLRQLLEVGEIATGAHRREDDKVLARRDPELLARAHAPHMPRLYPHLSMPRGEA